MESVDMVFDRMNDITTAQQTLSQQVQASLQKVTHMAEQQNVMVQQIRANGQAVANLTLRQLEKEDQYLSDTSTSVVFEEEDPDLHNVFAAGKKPMKTAMPRNYKEHHPSHSRETIPRNSLPKIQFPVFEGKNP